MKPIETERLILRSFAPTDEEDLHKYLGDPLVVRFEPYEPLTRVACKEEAKKRAEDSAFVAVCLKETSKLIGNIYLNKASHGTWELGYILSRSYWGKGYATEASRALITNAFEKHDAHRVTAYCNPLNTPSWKLMERLGMRKEAHHVKNIYFAKDEAGIPLWQDTYIYSILREEWHK